MSDGCSDHDQSEVFDAFTASYISPSWHSKIVVQPAPLVSRVWGAEIKGGDCAIWTGWSNGKGHGRVKIRKENWYIHRWTYMCHHNVWIPADVHIDHLCRNRPCINPATPLENFQRGNGPNHKFKSAFELAQKHHRDLFEEVPF